MASLKQAPLPIAVREAKNVRATVMAVTVAPVATVRNEVSAASARTARRLTASSRWKALPLILEDQMRCQPRWTVNHALAILQRLPPPLLRMRLRLHLPHALHPLRLLQPRHVLTAPTTLKLR